MSGNVKIGVQILYFDAHQFILETLNNCAHVADVVYVLYSEKPWLYNKEARNVYHNSSSLDTIRKSPHIDKVKIIQGVYDTEEEQRNEGLDTARSDDVDYLIIQDADEFYLPADYRYNIRQMINNPEYLYYRCPWMLFWKEKGRVIRFRNVEGTRSTVLNYNPAFALNCRTPVSFTNKRLVNTTDALFLEKPCFHMSYYCSDAHIERKINTWGHTNQIINKRKWLKHKWYGWKPQTKNLNPMNPCSWMDTVAYNGDLPEEVKRLELPEQSLRTASIWDRAEEWIYDVRGHVYYNVESIKKWVRTNIPLK